MKTWRVDTCTRHPIAPVLLVIAVILAVYYPALYSGFHTVDDTGIVAFYTSCPSLSHLLIPGNSFYYRPVIELSFFLDNLLWSMEPAVLHLENVLLHCANSLLVFGLVRRFSADKWSPGAVLAALLFAVHPVNVEATAWIAGRTDLLLTLFSLSCVWCWLNWFEKNDWRNFTGAVLFLCLALLTKETALFLGGVTLLLSFTRPPVSPLRQRLAALSVAVLPGAALVGVVLMSRHAGSAFGKFLAGAELSLADVVSKALIALGFYAKKLLLPLPLNFAVTELHPGYGFVAPVLVLLVWWSYRRCRSAAAWYAAAVLMIAPALLIAVKQIAWTPVAERYLYLPTACFCIGLAIQVSGSGREIRNLLYAPLMLLICFFAYISFERTLLWKDKPAFFEDAIKKSPGFGSLYNELGVLELQRGKVEEAEQHFITAEKLNRRESMRLLIKANLMSVQYAKGNHEAVREQFFSLFATKQEASADFLELLQRADGKRLNLLTGRERKLLAEDLLQTLEQLYRKRPDPFWLYRSGQLWLDEIGNGEKAADFFQCAYTAAPADAHYRKAIEIYMQKTKQSLQKR